MKKFLMKILFGGYTFPALPEIGLTITRLFVGLALALTHGRAKWPPSRPFIDSVAHLGFPAPTASAWMATLSEFIGGILMAIGLCTRPAAFFIMFTMAVAAYSSDPDKGFAAKEMALLYMGFAIVFLFVGGGKFSIDRFIRGKA